MQPNRTRAKLSAGQLVVGAVISVACPELVELCGAVGFDFVAIDAEHEPMDDREITAMIRAAEALGLTPIVRLGKEPDRILWLLDAGAQGVHIPRCGSGAEAQALLEWCRFYPEGLRTFYALGRSANYGIGVDDREWARAANAELLVMASIKEVEAVGRLAEILAVRGLDVIHVGPKDLWQSMGMPAQADVEAVIRRIIAGAVGAGKHVSVQLRLRPDLEGRVGVYRQLGVRTVSVSVLDFIRAHAPSLLEALRRGAP